MTGTFHVSTVRIESLRTVHNEGARRELDILPSGTDGNSRGIGTSRHVGGQHGACVAKNVADQSAIVALSACPVGPATTLMPS